MTPAEKAQIDAHVQAIAKILYADADKSQMTNRGQIESGIRAQLVFFITEITGTNDGYVRTIKSILGHLPLSHKQGQLLGIETGKRISPYLELCCLRISANVSYANAESDLEMLTGMSVSDNTQQRLVQRTES